MAQGACLGVRINTCDTKPRRVRVAPVPASRSSRSNIRGVWRRVCFGCAHLALAHRWAEAGSMGSCRSRYNAGRNVNNRVCSASEITRVCDRSTRSLQFDACGSSRETSQCAFKGATAVTETAELENGFQYRFTPGGELISELD